MSNTTQGGAGSAILGLLMLLGVGSCMFSGSSDPADSSTKTSVATANSADAPFLADNPGLQAAHNQSGSGDGFAVVIATKTSGCEKTVSATEVSHHRYQVICSAGMDGAEVRFAKFLVDTDTGFTGRMDATG